MLRFVKISAVLYWANDILRGTYGHTACTQIESAHCASTRLNATQTGVQNTDWCLPDEARIRLSGSKKRRREDTRTEDWRGCVGWIYKMIHLDNSDIQWNSDDSDALGLPDFCKSLVAFNTSFDPCTQDLDPALVFYFWYFAYLKGLNNAILTTYKFKMTFSFF